MHDTTHMYINGLIFHMKLSTLRILMVFLLKKMERCLLVCKEKYFLESSPTRFGGSVVSHWHLFIFHTYFLILSYF